MKEWSIVLLVQSTINNQVKILVRSFKGSVSRARLVFSFPSVHFLELQVYIHKENVWSFSVILKWWYQVIIPENEKSSYCRYLLVQRTCKVNQRGLREIYRSVWAHVWSRLTSDPSIANDSQIGPEMIPRLYRKHSSEWKWYLRHKWWKWVGSGIWTMDIFCKRYQCNALPTLLRYCGGHGFESRY